MRVRRLKFLRAFFLAQLVFVLGCAVTMWWCTKTEAGLRFTACRIEHLVSANIPGSLIIDRIDSFEWNRIRAHGIRISHQDGRSLLLARNAEITPDWIAALHGRIGFRGAAVDGGYVVLSMDPDDRLSLEAAMNSPRRPGEPNNPNGGVHYSLRSIHVQNLTVSLKFSDTFDYRIRHVEGYVGVLRIDTPGVQVILERIRGEVEQDIAGMHVALQQLDGWLHGEERQVMHLQANVHLASSQLVTHVNYYDRATEKLKIHVDHSEGLQAIAVTLLAKAVASFSKDLSIDG
jgi:hypothetical protein